MQKDCPDGKLSRSKFEKTYNSFSELQLKSENAHKFSKYLYKAFDKDRNGFIDFSKLTIFI